MKTFDLHIKNMVCKRCTIFVQQILQQLGVKLYYVELGHVSFSTQNELVYSSFEKKMNEAELFIIKDKEKVIVEEVKVQVVLYLQSLEEGKDVGNFSTFIAEALNRNYYSITKLFRRLENRTIESFVITKKIERVKNLLLEDDKNLSEIAYRLGYSNVQHLSSQFKKITSYSVSDYKAWKSYAYN